MTRSNETAMYVRDILVENSYLFTLFGIGAILLLIGFVPEYRETIALLGVALIIPGSVGIYMMLTTRKVASGLHKRFDELNDVLWDIAASQNGILKEIASSQKEMASSQKDIASSQNDILKEIASSQKEIASSQKEIASSQKEIASSQKEIASSQKEMASSQKDIASSQNDILKEIASSQKEIASSQKEIASSQRNVEGILKNIEEKITAAPRG